LQKTKRCIVNSDVFIMASILTSGKRRTS